MKKLLIVLLLLLIPVFSFAKESRINPICVSSHINWLDLTTAKKQVLLAKGAGVKTIRFDLAATQFYSDGAYNFSSMDILVDYINSNGMSVLAIIPQYDFPAEIVGENWNNVPTTTQYVDYAKKLTQHFKGKINLYEIGNEPDIDLFFYPHSDVKKYSQMLIDSYDIIKSVDSSAKIISAGLTSSDPEIFLKGMYANGVKGHFDYLGYHPYTWPENPLNAYGFTVMNNLNSIMMSNDDIKGIMATEVGFPSTTSSGGVSESTQALYITNIFNSTLKGNYSLMKVVCVYDLIDDGKNKNDPEHNFGLLKSDYSKKKSYNSVKSASDYFSNHFSAKQI